MSSLNHLIQLLPQAPPAVYIDEILERRPGEWVRARVKFPAGHRIFDGHLPEQPIVPGVILIEAMAQACGLALMGESGRPIRGYLGEVKHMRFRHGVRPDEEIRLTATLIQSFGGVFRFATSAHVGEIPAAEGEITVVAAKDLDAP